MSSPQPLTFVEVASAHPLLSLAAVVFLCLYWKGLPTVWHLRYCWTILTASRTKLDALDQAVVYHDRVLLSDYDFNLHLNNAMYNSAADFARIAFFSRLYGGIGEVRKHRPHNGGVSILFLKEIRFFEPFDIEVKLAGFNEKWMFLHLSYIGTHTRTLHAVGLTRMVAKYPSRKTIPPDALFKHLGYSIPPTLQRGGSFSELNARLEEDLRSLAGKHAGHR